MMNSRGILGEDRFNGLQPLGLECDDDLSRDLRHHERGIRRVRKVPRPETARVPNRRHHLGLVSHRRRGGLRLEEAGEKVRVRDFNRQLAEPERLKGDSAHCRMEDMTAVQTLGEFPKLATLPQRISVRRQPTESGRMSFGSEVQHPLRDDEGPRIPAIRQFTIFLENRVGQLLEVIRRFEGTGIRIVALSINDAAECAFVRFLISDADRGREILERSGLAIIETDSDRSRTARRSATAVASLHGTVAGGIEHHPGLSPDRSSAWQTGGGDYGRRHRHGDENAARKGGSDHHGSGS